MEIEERCDFLNDSFYKEELIAVADHLGLEVKSDDTKSKLCEKIGEVVKLNKSLREEISYALFEGSWSDVLSLFPKPYRRWKARRKLEELNEIKKRNREIKKLNKELDYLQRICIEKQNPKKCKYNTMTELKERRSEIKSKLRKLNA